MAEAQSGGGGAQSGGGGAVPHDALILAGGGGTRLGGVDKARLEVGGRPLLDLVLAGVTGARQIVVVGDTVVPAHVLQTVEDPPGGGPVAGIAAGLAVLSAPPPDWTLVLAVDQPGAGIAVPALLHAASVAEPETDLVCPHDDGHPQWLLAAYRTASLVRALAPLGSGHNVSVRQLTADLRIVDVPSDHFGDIDTWADHEAWQERLRGED